MTMQQFGQVVRPACNSLVAKLAHMFNSLLLNMLERGNRAGHQSRRRSHRRLTQMNIST